MVNGQTDRIGSVPTLEIILPFHFQQLKLGTKLIEMMSKGRWKYLQFFEKFFTGKMAVKWCLPFMVAFYSSFRDGYALWLLASMRGYIVKEIVASTNNLSEIQIK